MAIDIGTLVLMLALGYFGWITGTVFQLVRLLVVVVAAVLAFFVGKEMAIFHLGKSPELAAGAAATYWFFICLAVLWGLGTVAAKTLAGSVRDASIDRTASDSIGGALLGVLRGFGIAYMVVLGMWSLNQTQQKFDLPYASSKVFKFASSKDFLRSQTVKLQAWLDEHYTTDAPEEESDVGTIGDLPKDERSVLP